LSLVDVFAGFVGAVPHREVALPWGRAAVWDLGDGPPAVLLHGIAGSRRIFFRLAPLLAERRRVIVPPLRGDDRPRDDFGFEELLDDLGALLEALDLRGAALVGTSFGAALALAYAARSDPRVASVVAQGAFSHFRLRLRDRALLSATRVLPQELGAAYFARRVLRGRETRLLEAKAPGLGALLADWSRKTPFRTLRRRIRLIHENDLGPRIAADRTPLTLAHGALDPVVPPRHFERLCRLRPDARARRWEGEGHLVPLSSPQLIAGLL